MHSTVHFLSLLVCLVLSILNIYLSYDLSSKNQNNSRTNNTDETMFRFIDDIESHFNQVQCSATSTAQVSACPLSNRRYSMHVHVAVQISMSDRGVNQETNASHQHETYGDVHVVIIKQCVALSDVTKVVHDLRAFHMKCDGPRKVTGGLSTAMSRPTEGRPSTKMTVDDSLLMFILVLIMLVFSSCLQILEANAIVGQNDDGDSEQSNEEIDGNNAYPHDDIETTESSNGRTDTDESWGSITAMNVDEYTFIEETSGELFTEEGDDVTEVSDNGRGSSHQISEGDDDEVELDEVDSDRSMVDIEYTEGDVIVEFYGSPTIPEMYAAFLRDESMFPKRPKDSLRCPICLVDFVENSEHVALRCGHTHHCDCLLEWIEKGSAICPICRMNI